MKKITIIFSLATLLAGISGCGKKDGIDDDLSFLNSATTANNNKIFDITNDNSGKVTITPTGEGYSSYVVNYGHGTGAGASAVVMPGNRTTHTYPEGTYTVTIVSKSISGQETSATYPLQVTYRAPENVNAGIGSQSVHFLKVKPSAQYASSYLVYFGDVANEVGTPVASGAEIAHTYTDAGNYNIKVVALSGGAAKTEKTTPVTITSTFGVPVTFEDAGTNYFFGTFGGGQQFATVANPNASGLNVTAKVGKFTRGYESWSGTYSPVNPIAMGTGKKIKVLVYNPDPALIGKKLNIELENAAIANGIAVLKTAITKSGEWEELVFDFGTIGGIPATEKFNQLVLRFNDAFDGNGVGGTGSVIYLDNFRLTN
jgi:hypothetical protein